MCLCVCGREREITRKELETDRVELGGTSTLASKSTRLGSGHSEKLCLSHVRVGGIQGRSPITTFVFNTQSTILYTCNRPTLYNTIKYYNTHRLLRRGLCYLQAGIIYVNDHFISEAQNDPGDIISMTIYAAIDILVS